MHSSAATNIRKILELKPTQNRNSVCGCPSRPGPFQAEQSGLREEALAHGTGSRTETSIQAGALEGLLHQRNGRLGKKPLGQEENTAAGSWEVKAHSWGN